MYVVKSTLCNTHATHTQHTLQHALQHTLTATHTATRTATHTATQVKALGTLAMIDEGELDWKVRVCSVCCSVCV